MRVFKPKDPGESIPFSLDFTADLLTGETLATISSVTLTLLSGTTDPNMSLILGGAAQISGNEVVQLITSGMSGNRYALTALCTTSASRTLAQGGIITITPAALQ